MKEEKPKKKKSNKPESEEDKDMKKEKSSLPSQFKGKIRLVPRGMETSTFREKEMQALTPKNLSTQYKNKLKEFRNKWHGKSETGNKT